MRGCGLKSGLSFVIEFVFLRNVFPLVMERDYSNLGMPSV